MNFADFFKLVPLMGDIQKMIATVEKYMNNPEVMKAINLIKQIETDPDVKAAIATAEAVAKTLTPQAA